jgi:hypothetical protein
MTANYGAFDGNLFDADLFDVDFFEAVTPPASSWTGKTPPVSAWAPVTNPAETWTATAVLVRTFSPFTFSRRPVFDTGPAAGIWDRIAAPSQIWTVEG